MAVSGVADWNPVLLEIIKAALLNATAIDETEEPAAPLYGDGLFRLNAMVKTIEATGAHVWTEEEGILFLQPDQARYVIGGAGAAHTADADEWQELELAAAVAAGASTVTITDASILLDPDQNIGIVNNNGATEWFTIDSIVLGDTVNLSGALEVGCDAGNFALVYTTAINRPLKVPNARLLTLNGLNETPMTIMSRQEYMDQPQKLTPGVPTQWFYSPRRDTGLLYVWTAPQFSNWAVRFTWYRPLQDFLVPSNTADFPQEWINPLIWNLSKELAPGYGVPTETWNRIVTMADTYGMMVVDYDRESEPIQFGMEYPTGAP
jgi:hypothetical protein